jgi:membrane protease YdiL (CAAX protease family)
VVARRPVAVLLTVGIAFVWVTQVGSLLAGVDVMPAKIAELVLLGGATWIGYRVGGRSEIRRLYAGLTRWRLGWRYPTLVLAMPLLTLSVALATRTLHAPAAGWGSVILTYRLFLVLGAVTGKAVTGNLWEETVWGGFVQGRLMAARGLLIGSLLTAVPFFLMHLPLAFEVNGWHGTTWHDALVDWGPDPAGRTVPAVPDRHPARRHRRKHPGRWSHARFLQRGRRDGRDPRRVAEHPGPDHPHPRRRRLPGPPGGVGDRGVRAAARPCAARLRRSAMTGTTRSSS